MSWSIGVPVVMVATLARVALLPATTWRWRFGGALRFLGHFAHYPVIGGLDVARRAFHTQLPLTPGFHEHTMRLRQEPARTFFVSVVSLLPGTLSANLHGERVTVHMLDKTRPVAEQLQALDGVIALLFGGQSPPGVLFRRWHRGPAPVPGCIYPTPSPWPDILGGLLPLPCVELAASLLRTVRRTCVQSEGAQVC